MIRRVMADSVDARIAVSDALRRAIEANDLPGFQVVHNAIEVDEAPVDPRAVEAFRGKFGLGGDPTLRSRGASRSRRGISRP